MELSPKQKQQVQMKFDSYCKKTIKGEVKHYWRELTRQKSKESLFSELTRQELECKFCSNGTPILKSAVHSF
ncbi:hypothetical protein [Mediterraneibacter gnavus]|uniref:hypothetical protein n=1 Tax=Mediterraneibacter gnavus TaxID=33038 RepID=UPI0032194FFF